MRRLSFRLVLGLCLLALLVLNGCDFLPGFPEL